MRLTHCFILLLTFCCLNSQAEEPRIIFPEGNAAWTVSVTPLYRAEAELPPEHVHGKSEAGWELKRIEVTRVSKLTRGRYVWSGGKTSEVWWLTDPPMMLAEKPDGSEIHADAWVVGASATLPDDRLFNWLKNVPSTDQRSYKGRKCFYYESLETSPGQVPSHISSEQKQKSPHQAWIDAETLLPVAMNDGQFLYEFNFQPTPNELLELPPRFHAELTRAKNSTPDPKFQGKKRSWQ